VHPGLGWRGPSDKRWFLRLKKKNDDPVTIRASLHLPGEAAGDSYDYERLMTLEVSGLSVVTKENRVIVSVKSENGRRFRYGGMFPVALDPDDPDVAVRVDTAPELLSEPVVEVKSAGLIDREAKVAATVGKSGKVTWVHPRTIDLHWISDDVWMRISDAVSRFQFRPARGEGHPVAENVVITVRLVPQQKG